MTPGRPFVAPPAPVAGGFGGARSSVAWFTPMTATGPGPRTRAGLAADLSRLGVRDGDVVLVHASLRALGRVAGGAATVVRALLDVVGPGGTVVVPAMTPDNSDPSRWEAIRGEPAPERSWPVIRRMLPAFDPACTPSFRMGAVAEAVRRWPGSVRSGHPQSSFAATGALAGPLMADHDRRCHLGPGSPLARLHDRAGHVLLLGVSWEVCTAFHLAEYLQPSPPRRDYECVVSDGGARYWLRYEDVELIDADFGRLGAAFEASARGSGVRIGPVGAATARLFPLRDAVDFAVGWLRDHRGPAAGQDGPGQAAGSTPRARK